MCGNTQSVTKSTETNQSHIQDGIKEGKLGSRKVENYTQKAKQLEEQINSWHGNNEQLSQMKQYLPTKYSQQFTPFNKAKGLLIFALFVSIVVAFALMNVPHLSELPQKIVHAFQHIDYRALAIGLGVTAILVGGTSVVIYRAMKFKDPLLDGADIGKLRGSAHIEEAISYEIVENTEGEPSIHGNFDYPLYIDTSTLENGNGKAYIYGVKGLGDHYTVSSIVTIATPFYGVGTVAYNVLRAGVAPVYVLGGCAVDACREKGVFEKKYSGERKFSLIDIPHVIKDSVWRIVKAPFYTCAYLVASIMSLFTPFAGRKLATRIERNWNAGVTRTEGFWSVNGPQELWPGWKGIAPNGLHVNAGGYLAGCWAPLGVATYENGKIVRAISLSKAVLEQRGEQAEERGHELFLFTRSEIEAASQEKA